MHRHRRIMWAGIIGTSVLTGAMARAGYECVVITQQMTPDPVNVQSATDGQVEVRYVDDLHSLQVETRAQTVRSVSWGLSTFLAATAAGVGANVNPSPFVIAGASGGTTNGASLIANVSGSPGTAGYWLLQPFCRVYYSDGGQVANFSPQGQQPMHVHAVGAKLELLTVADASNTKRVAESGGTLQMVQATALSNRSAKLTATNEGAAAFSQGEPTWTGSNYFQAGNATQTWTGERDATITAEGGGVTKSVNIDLVDYKKTSANCTLNVNLFESVMEAVNGPLSNAGIKLSASVNGSASGFVENVDKYEDSSVGTKLQGRTACSLAAGIAATVGVPIPPLPPAIKFVFGGSANATLNLTETTWTYDDAKAPANRQTITEGTISGKLTLSGKIGVALEVVVVSGEVGANVTGGGTFEGTPSVGTSGVLTVSGRAAFQPIMANCYGTASVKLGPLDYKLIDWRSTVLPLWSPQGDGVPYTFSLPLLPPV